MPKATHIEWTNMTWNPVTGCSKVSQGCKNCYAERMAKRLHAMGSARYLNKFEVTLHWDLVDLPRSWKQPRTVFVNSMSDLFHKDTPEEFIQRVFDIMRRASWHVFQILTKRSDRLLALSPKIDWPDNVWMGVSVESADYTHRIDHLRGTGAKVRFLSVEPLLGAIPQLNLHNIHWVIVGGESGPGARPMREEWVIEIRDQCQQAGVPFFFKQWGGVNKKKTGRELQGRTWDEMPDPV